MSDPIGVVVCGAAGRMGRLLVALAGESGLRVAGAIEATGHPALGRDAGEVAGAGACGVRLTDDAAAVVRAEHVVLSFTMPQATVEHVHLAAERGAGVVVGTTGLDAEQDRAMRAAAARTRSVIAANYSVGVTVLTELVATASRLLDASFETEIVELHHHAKRDAPSGTALALGRAAAAGRGRELAQVEVSAREGLVGARRPNEIGIFGLRGGDAVGDHTVFFCGLGERLELTHRAQSRECLVRGALRAARWVATQPAGIYAMRDVLGL